MTKKPSRLRKDALAASHEMAIVDHLIELRRRLLYSVFAFFSAFLVCYYFSEEIFAFLIRPLAEALKDKEGRRLIYTGLAEAFFTYLKVAFFSAAFLSFPIVANQLWIFIAPGLYSQEKRVALPFLLATPILFFLGAAFAYYIIIPPAWQFFLNFETHGTSETLPIQLEARVGEYLSIIMRLIMAFGICFQLPILLFLLARVGILQYQMLEKYRKYSFIMILVVSALLTPPDVLSMVGLALPLYGLYEISILLIRLLIKTKK